MATVILNPTPSINDNYLWIPEVSDNVVPGLGSILTCSHIKYATLTSLQNAATFINHNIQTEINSLRIPNQGNVNVSKENITIIIIPVILSNEKHNTEIR